jgi:quercetin dioxygenase-like cupin family protein
MEVGLRPARAVATTFGQAGPKNTPISSEWALAGARRIRRKPRDLRSDPVDARRAINGIHPRYPTMTDKPTTIVHPLSGERIVFRQRSRDTGGTLLEADNFVAPRGAIKPHIHPNMEETFRIQHGPITFRIDGVESTHQVGDTVVIPRGAVHEWWNPVEGDEVAATMEFRPALDMETFFETWFGLAADGKLDERGMPPLLQTMVLMRDFRREITVPGRDGMLIRMLGPLLAPLGRRAGYRSRYERYSGQAEANAPTVAVVNL